MGSLGQPNIKCIDWFNTWVFRSLTIKKHGGKSEELSTLWALEHLISTDRGIFQKKSVTKKKVELTNVNVVQKSMYHTNMFALEDSTGSSYGNEIVLNILYTL